MTGGSIVKRICLVKQNVMAFLDSKTFPLCMCSLVTIASQQAFPTQLLETTTI